MLLEVSYLDGMPDTDSLRVNQRPRDTASEDNRKLKNINDSLISDESLSPGLDPMPASAR
jgi:hypothetical protein